MLPVREQARSPANSRSSRLSSYAMCYGRLSPIMDYILEIRTFIQHWFSTITSIRPEELGSQMNEIDAADHICWKSSVLFQTLEKVNNCFPSNPLLKECRRDVWSPCRVLGRLRQLKGHWGLLVDDVPVNVMFHHEAVRVPPVIKYLATQDVASHAPD